MASRGSLFSVGKFPTAFTQRPPQPLQPFAQWTWPIVFHGFQFVRRFLPFSYAIFCVCANAVRLADTATATAARRRWMTLNAGLRHQPNHSVRFVRTLPVHLCGIDVYRKPTTTTTINGSVPRPSNTKKELLMPYTVFLCIRCFGAGHLAYRFVRVFYTRN